MAGDREEALDAALARLARIEAAAAPRASEALMAKILADAADTAAAAVPAAAPLRAPAGAVRRRWGWIGGAIAAMTMSLTLGMGVGYAGAAPEEVISGLTGSVPAQERGDAFGGDPF